MYNILLLNNHDSFTWNLVELLRGIGKINIIIRIPEELHEVDLHGFDKIIFSPGPGLPDEQPGMYHLLKGVEDLWMNHGKKVDILGVCLGMQAIACFYGGSLYNLPSVVHGQPGRLRICVPGHPLFSGIPQGCEVGLYHSWAVNQATLPGCLETLAVSANEIIMALSHKVLPIMGVQFHPESIMTPEGRRMMQNWLNM